MIELFLDNFKGDNTLYTFADIHCHTLYNVDDGAHNDNVMKNMLDTAYGDMAADGLAPTVEVAITTDVYQVAN